MSAQKQPGDRTGENTGHLEEPKEFPKPEEAAPPAPEVKLIDYKGFKIVPEPERKKHHPLIEAAISAARLPFKVLVEWPMDAINRLEQRFADKRNREMYEKAERDIRLRKMFPKEEEKKHHSEG